ncbi:MAG: ABC transporter ATP-binding protein [Thermodesulfobacteriota bacterium]|nr:ABC transporter ATP-binding protein [Thermodesulfobacteriota bacterium]
MEDIIIETTDLRCSIDNKVILDGISLIVHKREYLSIVGPNGAGKSTLLKCLDRIFPCDKPCIRIAGRPLKDYTQRQLARIVSYVPQVDGHVPPFSVYEFVMMGRYPYLRPFSSPSRQDKEAVYDVMSMTSTLEFADRPLDTLSGGERQKVYIASALAQGAGVLFLDEPTTFLDPRHESEVYQLLAKANRERGVTVISVTHDINSAVLTGRRVLALKDGRVAFMGDAGALMNNDVLCRIYDKEFLFMKHPETGDSIIAPQVPR